MVPAVRVEVRASADPQGRPPSDRGRGPDAAAPVSLDGRGPGTWASEEEPALPYWRARWSSSPAACVRFVARRRIPGLGALCLWH